jgi:ubiquinone/menaquinone biosynthesis C-methylase UbiE
MDQPQVSLPYPVLSDESEIERLLRVAERYADQARDLCQRAGLQPGGRVVEIGCGPVGALLVLSQVAGPSGSVVGLDANAIALERPS